MRDNDDSSTSPLTSTPDLHRRGFMTTFAAAGFALATRPICAQTMILTPDEGLTSGSSTVNSGGEALPLFYAKPTSGKTLPTVLVVQEIFGVHEYIRDVCRRLAHLGYLAIAPELFFRQGDPSGIDNIDDILRNIVSRVSDAQVLSDLDACATWASSHGGDPERLGITGFCWGGRITWLYAAHNAKISAGIAWYGRLKGLTNDMTPRHPIDIAEQLSVPVLGLYGGQDQGIPLDDVNEMRKKLKLAGSQNKIIVYPDAPHAFHADYRPSYRRDAAEDAWKQSKEWLNRYMPVR